MTLQRSAWIRPVLGFCAATLLLSACAESSSVLVSSVAASAEDVGDAIALRGYGVVQPVFTDTMAQFSCEDAAHAEILASKLVKDLTAYGAQPGVLNNVTIAGTVVPYLELSDQRVCFIWAEGVQVFMLEFATQNALVDYVIESLDLEQISFAGVDAHPKYLDYYDNNSVRFYTQAMSEKEEGLDSHWAHVKRLGLGGLSVQAPSLPKSPAPGILPYASVDFELAEAKRQDGFVVLGPNVGGALPLWIYNDAPELTAKLQDASLFGGWSHGTFASTVESDGEAWDPSHSPILAMHKQIVERYRDHPNLGGWHLNRGQPVGDMIGTLMDGTLWDSSDVAIRSMREWLKQRYSLSELGERWHGDADYYANWDQVIPDQLMDVVGGKYEKNRLLLSDRQWDWSTSEAGQDGEYPGDAERKWLTIDMAPSQRAMFLDSGSSYFRLQLDTPDYFSQGTDQPLNLKFVAYSYVSRKMVAWVNGQKFESPVCRASGIQQYAISIPAGVFKAGETNEIIFQTPETGRSDGRIHGPISISEEPAQQYPYADAKVNAIYVDTMGFKVDAACRRIVEAIRWGRQFEPNRPLVISGGWWPSMAALAPIAAKYGVGLQYTAVEGFYCDWYAEIARVNGSYFSAEPSGAVLKEAKFDRMLGMLLYRGDSSIDLFHNVEQYVTFDRETGYLTRNAKLLQQIGKSLNETPQVALLSSKLSQTLGASSFWTWNLGRGELESIHIPSTYLSETEVAKGFSNDYPVLFDTGSSIMTEKTVADLQDYVEQGGTFVTFSATGRHTALVRDVQPISELTGFRVASTNESMIRWNDELPMFSDWAGQSFRGIGMIRDWQNVDGIESSAVSLEPIEDDVQILAYWEDGTPAVGIRKVGKGTVVTLGATFWRQARDITGKWLPVGNQEYLRSLMAGLGITKNVDASSAKIWVRKSTTKNGLEDWLLATNVAEREPFDVTADLELQLDYVPAEVVDVLTGDSVPFTVDDEQRIFLKDIAFSKYQTRIFSASRPSAMVDAVRFWWKEKERYWHRSPEETLPMPTAFELNTIPLDTWRFLPDQKNTVVTDEAWKLSDFDDSSWATLPSGSWKLIDPKLSEYEGVGLYRYTFNIPEDWATSAVTFNYMPGVAAGRAEFYVNGKRVAEYSVDGHNNELQSEMGFDITEHIDRNTANVLAVKVYGTEGILSGVCGTAWIGEEKALKPKINLSGEWESIAADQMTAKPLTLPGKTHARFLRREFEVPADWDGQSIFVRLVTPSNWCSAIVVNGRAKSKDFGFTPFASRVEVNVSEMIKPGEKNVIELWHRYTIPVGWRGLGWNWPSEAPMTVDQIEIGCTRK